MRTLNHIKRISVLALMAMIFQIAYSNDLIRLVFSLPPKVQADAGNDLLINLGQSAIISESPTAIDGFAPYSYSWVPKYGLSDSLVSNPSANPEYCITYMLWVKDSLGCTSFDFVDVYVLYDGMLVKRGDNLDIITKEMDEDALRIFPNPTKRYAFIQCGYLKDEYIEIQICSVDGKSFLIKKQKKDTNPILIDLGKMNKGMYFLKLSSGSKVYSGKIFIE